MAGQELASTERFATPWRYSLGGLLGLVTLICVWLTLFVHWTTECEIRFQCGSMPPNDHALIAWLQRQAGTRDIHVTRNENSVIVRFSKREFVATFDALSPPLKDLGYDDVEALATIWTSGLQAPLRTAFQWLLRNYWFLVAPAAAAILLSIYLAGRKLGESDKDDTGPENSQRVT